MEEEIKKEIKRRPDGTYMPGISGNPSGRPKNTLKDYVREKFNLMSPEEKEDFLKKVTPIDIWKMGEGNPAQDVTSGGEKIEVIPILGGITQKDDNKEK